MAREDVSFLSSGARCSAWWYPPAEAPGPVVVMAHFLGATREMGLDRFARRFNQAGYGVLAFDYRHLGASEGEPRQLIAFRRQQDDWRAALEYVRAREDVDPGRVALWGPSMSGGNAIAVAARDPGLAAVIATAPFTDGVASVLALGVAQSLRLTAAGLRDLACMARGAEPHRIRLAGVRGEPAVMVAPEALPAYEGLVPEGAGWRNEAAARMALAVGLYRPIRMARRVSCPLLIQAFEDDPITPPGPSAKAARLAPRGQLETYPGGHFAPFFDRYEEALGRQLDFLGRYLAPRHEQVAA